jgi:hypothetical protein
MTVRFNYSFAGADLHATGFLLLYRAVIEAQAGRTLKRQ